MSEATTTTQITEAEWEAARSAGLLFAAPGSSAQDAAIHKFAVAMRADLLKAAIELLREFPTDSDLLQAGWSFTDIEGAMKVHEATCAVVIKVIGEAA